MPANKKLIILLAVAAFCAAAVGIVAVGVAFLMRHESGLMDASGLTLYKIDQTPSRHPGYLRDTLASASEAYVSDYEESALRPESAEPKPFIGRIGTIGNARVCAIPGEPRTAYIAGDVGSEMPAYQVFRHSRHPAFDWRAATFREMTFIAPRTANTGIRTTDPTLLAEVVSLLRDGKPTELPHFSMVASATMANLDLATDQLPGILFCPFVQTDAKGAIYIAESLMLDTSMDPPEFHARWIAASPNLTQWLQSRPR